MEWRVSNATLESVSTEVEVSCCNALAVEIRDRPLDEIGRRLL